MPVTSTCTDVGSMGDRKYAYGTYRQSGVGRVGFILVPMGRVDYIQLQDVPLVSGIGCSGTSHPYGITFPYSSGVGTAVNYSTQSSRNNIPVAICFSGATGQWWAFGKRG